MISQNWLLGCTIGILQEFEEREKVHARSKGKFIRI
jgi:hypothetical protein